MYQNPGRLLLVYQSLYDDDDNDGGIQAGELGRTLLLLCLLGFLGAGLEGGMFQT